MSAWFHDVLVNENSFSVLLFGTLFFLNFLDWILLIGLWHEILLLSLGDSMMCITST